MKNINRNAKKTLLMFVIFFVILSSACLIAGCDMRYGQGVETEDEIGTIDMNVRGFNYGIITFEGKRIESNEDVIDSLCELIDKYNLRYSSLVFIVYINEKIDPNDKILMDMHYSDIYITNYNPFYIELTVKYADVDLSALKELSFDPRVSVIHIMEPAIANDE